MVSPSVLTERTARRLRFALPFFFVPWRLGYLFAAADVVAVALGFALARAALGFAFARFALGFALARVALGFALARVAWASPSYASPWVCLRTLRLGFCLRTLRLGLRLGLALPLGLRLFSVLVRTAGTRIRACP